MNITRVTAILVRQHSLKEQLKIMYYLELNSTIYALVVRHILNLEYSKQNYISRVRVK